ncbi:MAG: UDP-N-acetylmuramoyl-L-alanine--D-glutamate ligase [Patescibacteria group bacterium]
MAIELKNKKVLVMGLGLLGGGVATTKWLVLHGANVTVTDLRSRGELKDSINKLGAAAKKIIFVLGKHRRADFKTNKIIVVNPAVPRESKYLAIAKKHGARLENEASLFFRYCKNPIIAVTGTRGKTTTVNWIYFLLKQRFPKARLTGNSSDQPMLGILDGLDGKSPVVAELSSWHLELLNQSNRPPEIAVITNIYRDHMNRYKSVKDYASAKANIFKNQKKGDFLILNKKNEWTKFFLKKFSGWKISSKIIYSSAKTGINEKKFSEIYGPHNLENLKTAYLAAKLAGASVSKLRRAAWHLPQIKYRQELIFESPKLKIINDTTATSPDGTMAALRRFGKENIILIAGGTDKNLEYAPPAGGWAKTVKRFVKPEQLYLLNGSATKKMIAALEKIGYSKNKKINFYEDLGGILKYTTQVIYEKKEKKTKWMIIFSPGAASFEKFKNEFDRGEKFNLYCKKIFKRR